MEGCSLGILPFPDEELGFREHVMEGLLESKLFISLHYCLSHRIPVVPDQTRVAYKVFADFLISYAR